jgi:hypothetical protein
MEDIFILEVEYKGAMHEFPAQLQMVGYIHRFVVTLPTMDVWFEQDEEGAYRAIIPYDTPLNERDLIDAALLQAIGLKIESILA